MRILLLSVFSFSMLVSQDVSQDQMQIMMQDMGKMQACINKIDMNAIQTMHKESVKIEKEIKQMCSQGQRDQAQIKAVAYSKKIMNIPAMKQMKECSKNTMVAEMLETETNNLEKYHVCDGKEIDFGGINTKRINW